VVRDRRRFDPDTGELRESARTPDSAAADHSSDTEAVATDTAELETAKSEAAERLNDLKRLQAEYVNYRKRVERDRELVRENAVGSVLGEMLGILDDIGRARDHGDLTGGFRSVGEAIEGLTQKLGLVRYGEVGDAFDPTIHEALMHEYSDEVSTPTCTQVLMPGYRHGQKVLRAARVAVAEPTEALPDTGAANEEAAVNPDADSDDPAADNSGNGEAEQG
jgi:molecular chaperone GrpE